ncbi:hypothetical protein SCATT_p12520 (plasmid) [Streptantibioticus cattleyicolor NRRL 8057 = DSM 46488]|uniref:Uncharacterized protein n=1 Tax=Streptantibioticus cattleyicolor (strain ATCC 35852 / DSM 46488 / JCM 4925 / NBRC 14057 / NRRL 8057) TaxID=1003195 RepID=G8XFA3_STREN|nr:hypothetical protein SCATT_p12520 [Streptantibioticus cattleyicolor NRRL 8057 = DSM 46488]
MRQLRGFWVTDEQIGAGEGRRCEKCHQPVVEGPEGGYVCGLCFHLVEPDGYAERRAAGVEAAAAQRRARTLDRRRRRPSG